MKFRAELDYTEDEPENPATKEEIDQELVYLSKRLSHTKTISKVQEGAMKLGDIEAGGRVMDLLSRKNHA